MLVALWELRHPEQTNDAPLLLQQRLEVVDGGYQLLQGAVLYTLWAAMTRKVNDWLKMQDWSTGSGGVSTKSHLKTFCAFFCDKGAAKL